MTTEPIIAVVPERQQNWQPRSAIGRSWVVAWSIEVAYFCSLFVLIDVG